MPTSAAEVKLLTTPLGTSALPVMINAPRLRVETFEAAPMPDVIET
ncbi:hypothetical protein FRUB_01265 [Fimbriiglobus ruber]|uniref:Uncharacterized protein n=1 Tax=Fimbriiglobus ruber TaxID=1908690 RepID=A0A225EC40_9BACT|nr:hypothetical protein FRUB_07954 [Fimbriiglobus ruber]OWK39550.1 hypothetical protein FRUB_06113 [Fimbriiglobus ruber]OWK42462.1 hypothetical protein FRUB_04540 [Fimbriiglobus ruber]OWK47566.1 hypothetical protein FRUB_01265 [Fimbriiglobus ruber]